MNKDIKLYLHFYINAVDYRVRYVDNAPGTWSVWSKLTPGRYARAVEDFSVAEIQINPRKLESMTEDEMKGLLLSMWPPEIEGKPDNDEYDMEMFYNDGGNMVDGNVAAGANYTCRCYEGQIAVRETGDIDLYDEDGEHVTGINQTAAFHYLLSRGFWLFGNDWFDEGLIIDKETLKG